MRPIRALPILLSTLLCACHPAHAAGRHHRASPRPAPPGSFTSLRVESFAELKSQVSHDRTVRQRYARFFHMSESAVPEFVRTELVPIRLAHAQTCVVYFISPSGKFYSHSIRLKPGSRVFALRSGGQPALNFVCGNGFLIPIKNKAYSVTDNLPADYRFGVDTPTDSPIQLASASAIEAIGPAETLVSPYSSFSPSGVSRFLPLAALGLLEVPTGHSSTPPVVAAVPEPGVTTLLLVGVPVLGLALRRRRA